MENLSTEVRNLQLACKKGLMTETERIERLLALAGIHDPADLLALVPDDLRGQLQQASSAPPQRPEDVFYWAVLFLEPGVDKAHFIHAM